MVADGVVYFGSQDGTVYALRASDGSLRWTYKASGAVKGSPTLKAGVLYFGDYGGVVHAISAATGQKIWSAATSGALLGAGTFYSTAAVAFGRVYIGNTDGHMYSFAARTGKLAWAYQTGNYVYASAAVLDAPTLGPTVYVGSYDGTLYAFDAAVRLAALEVPPGRQDLGLGDGHRTDPVLREPRHARDHGARHRHGQAGLAHQRGQLRPGDLGRQADLPLGVPEPRCFGPGPPRRPGDDARRVPGQLRTDGGRR